MKKILVVYYTQTGQLKNIVDSVLSPLTQETSGIVVDTIEIKPVKPFPFPWTLKDFFNAFPESALEIPIELEPVTLDNHIDADLVVLAYQPWFLSPSLPISSFLQTSLAQKIFAGKRVITVIGCRNMWTQAQELIKKRLRQMNAELVGNIVLVDRAYNLISIYTILKWLLYGKKGNSGVSQKDIEHAKIFGEYILSCILNDVPVKQDTLVELGAVNITYNLVMMEARASVIFRKFASFIIAGGPSKRSLRIKLFQMYLCVAIVVLAPFTLIISAIMRLVAARWVKNKIKYFQGIKML